MTNGEVDRNRIAENCDWLMSQPCTCQEKKEEVVHPMYRGVTRGHDPLPQYDVEGRLKLRCPDCNKKYTEEPKQECDHVLGFFVSSTGVQDDRQVDIEEIRISSKNHGCNIILDHCSKCGEKLNLKKEEKKECEHAPADVKQGWVFNSLTSYPLWLCKCGLVTCKNPNE